MEAVYLSAKVGEDTSLCIAPLTRRRILAAGVKIEDAGGYYLFERTENDPDSIEILARLPSEEAALRLGQLLRLV